MYITRLVWGWLVPKTKFKHAHIGHWLHALPCLQVTYRVVQVTDDQLEAAADGTGAVSVVSTAAFAGAPQAVAQVS